MTRIVGGEGDGGAIEPLRWVRYVDADTQATTHDGSIAAPFLTVQEAFDDLSAKGFTRGAILICPETSIIPTAGPLVVPADSIGFELAIVGIGASERTAETGGTSEGFGLVVPFAGLSVGTGGTNVHIILENLAGVLSEGTTGAIVAIGAEPEPPAECAFSLCNCYFARINAPESRVLMQGSTVANDVDANSIDAYETTTGGGGGAATWTAQVIRLDESTNRELTILGCTLTADSIEVLGRCQRATFTVAVPNLANVTLGYVDVDTTGNMAVDVGDVVVAAPVADLHAAGANGGFLAYARVSALNTVRLAFVGALTAGNVDFVIARV